MARCRKLRIRTPDPEPSKSCFLTQRNNAKIRIMKVYRQKIIITNPEPETWIHNGPDPAHADVKETFLSLISYH
jgi:hypothetical protein